MAALTRLSLDGYGAKRAGSFAGKATPAAERTVGRITRLSLDGYGARRAGSFAGKEASSPVIVAAAQEDTGAGSGRLRRRNIPPIRLPDGRIHFPETWQEFNQLYAAIEHRTGEPPEIEAQTIVIAAPDRQAGKRTIQLPVLPDLPPVANIDAALRDLDRLMQRLEDDETAVVLLLLH